MKGTTKKEQQAKKKRQKKEDSFFFAPDSPALTAWTGWMKRIRLFLVPMRVFLLENVL
jgi:hypothetical protein